MNNRSGACEDWEIAYKKGAEYTKEKIETH